MYALDTNTLIYFFKGDGNVATELFKRSPSEIGLPAIVLYELEVGIAKSQAPEKRIRLLAELTDLLEIMPFGAGEARAAAQIRAQLARNGATIGPLDLLIAGTALARHAVLVTHNTKEFQRINKLQLEDWY